MYIAKPEVDDWHGVDTRLLALFLLLLCVCLAVRVLVWRLTRGSAEVRSLSIDRYQMAWMLSSEHVVATAVAELIDEGAVDAWCTRDQKVLLVQPRVDGAGTGNAIQDEVLQLLRTHRGRFRIAWAFARSRAGREVDRTLEEAGLLVGGWRRRAAQLSEALFPLVVLSMSVAYAMNLEANPALPVGVLLVTWIVWGQAWVHMPVRCTALGVELFNRLQRAILCSRQDQGKVPDGALHWDSLSLSKVRARNEFALEWAKPSIAMVPLVGMAGYRNESRVSSAVPGQWRSVGIEQQADLRRDPSIGWLYQFLVVVCVLLYVHAVVFALLVHVLPVIVLFLALVPLTVKFIGLAKQHRTVSGREVLSSGPRSVVLHLRSFADDASGEQNEMPEAGVLGPRDSAIEEVTSLLGRFGAVVSIGDPKDELPGVGPARIYVPPAGDDSGQTLERWQSEVLGLLRYASLVLISSGRGTGLQWEIRQAVSLLSPERIVVLLPPGGPNYGDFRRHTAEYFPNGLPPAEDLPVEDDGSPRGFIYFESDWTSHFSQLERSTLVQLHKGKIVFQPWLRKSRNALVHALYPIFRNTGVPGPGWKIPVPFGARVRNRTVEAPPYFGAGLCLTTLALVVVVFGST